ncbi:hypothetical protein DKX38_017573 [Salix brachista]|uniref:Uncharacterized protein n=1 Tax=Salix brachista TaxID=2182728 RepID=A0A5N5KVP8_9ROSI|nr:hypothetical protein DKX38_017573 [Salix brachista]
MTKYIREPAADIMPRIMLGHWQSTAELNQAKDRAPGLAALFVSGASLTCSTFSNGISSTSAEKSESFSELALLDEEKLEDGVQSGDSLSSTPTGGETPNVINLRKQQRKEPERPLYQVSQMNRTTTKCGATALLMRDEWKEIAFYWFVSA